MSYFCTHCRAQILRWLGSLAGHGPRRENAVANGAITLPSRGPGDQHEARRQYRRLRLTPPEPCRGCGESCDRGVIEVPMGHVQRMNDARLWRAPSRAFRWDSDAAAIQARRPKAPAESGRSVCTAHYRTAAAPNERTGRLPRSHPGMRTAEQSNSFAVAIQSRRTQLIWAATAANPLPLADSQGQVVAMPGCAQLCILRGQSAMLIGCAGLCPARGSGNGRNFRNSG
jgi:hypothetical protein